MKEIVFNKSVFLILILFSLSNYVFSDSPLTSTPFYKVYSELEIINVILLQAPGFWICAPHNMRYSQEKFL